MLYSLPLRASDSSLSCHDTSWVMPSGSFCTRLAVVPGRPVLLLLQAPSLAVMYWSPTALTCVHVPCLCCAMQCNAVQCSAVKVVLKVLCCASERAVLCYAVLWYAILFCAALGCAVLYCSSSKCWGTPSRKIESMASITGP